MDIENVKTALRRTHGILNHLLSSVDSDDKSDNITMAIYEVEKALGEMSKSIDIVKLQRHARDLEQRIRELERYRR
jgi:hypothetical protein